MTHDEKREMVEARLEWLAKHGPLTPEALVEDARDPDSPLHNEFEWEDTKAAHKWRIEQARTLLSSVRLTIINEDRILSTVAYVRDPDAGAREQGYVRTVDLKGDRERVMAMLASETARAEAYLRRVISLAEVLNIAGELEQVMKWFAAFHAQLLSRRAVGRKAKTKTT